MIGSFCWHDIHECFYNQALVDVRLTGAGINCLYSSFDPQTTYGSLICFSYFLLCDMLFMGVCTTKHWQTSGRLVQELDVCTEVCFPSYVGHLWGWLIFWHFIHLFLIYIFSFILFMGACTAWHWQTPSRLVQEANVSTLATRNGTGMVPAQIGYYKSDQHPQHSCQHNNGWIVCSLTASFDISLISVKSRRRYSQRRLQDDGLFEYHFLLVRSLQSRQLILTLNAWAART